MACNRKTWKTSRIDKLWVAPRTRAGHKKVLAWRDAYDAEMAFVQRLAMLSSDDPKITRLKARIGSRYSLQFMRRDDCAVSGAGPHTA